MKRVITLAVVVLGALALGVGAAPAARAHGGDGVLELEAAHPTTTGVHVIVQLTYQNDGDAVSGATVTATPISPSGEELEAVTLSPAAAGSYQGPVDMPDTGRWTVRFASVEPPATLEETVEVEATSTSTSPASGEDEGAAGFAPADDGTGDSAADDGDSGSDGVPILLVVAAAVVAIGGVITALRIVLRNRPTPTPAPEEGGSAETAESPASDEPAEGKATGSTAPGTGPTGSTAPGTGSTGGADGS